MNKIGIITNKDKDLGLSVTSALVQSITKRGGTAVLTSDLAALIGAGTSCESEEALLLCSDAVICLGGDGTFLGAARSAYQYNIPMLGINLGRLGFLTEVDQQDMDTAIEHLFKGQYTLENRMMLEVTVKRAGVILDNGVALNDIVISRGALSRILHVKTYINNVFVDTFPGDGLIIASPTGSTAYSLSAGGPIVEPDIDLMIITPICPHILYSRSFIASGDRVVKVEMDEGYTHNAMVTVDGQKGIEIRGGDIIEVKKASFGIQMIKMNSINFFNILRSKIYYRGEGLKQDEIQQARENT